MSDDEFDQMFGQQPRQKFTERVGRVDPLGDGPRAAREIAAADAGAETGIYKAFGSPHIGAVTRGCEVRRWLDATEIAEGIVFPYRLVLRLDFTGEDDLQIVLPDAIVSFTGAFLLPLREGLMREQVSFIQQFSPRVWPAGRRPGETIITHIDIVRGGDRASTGSRHG